MPMLYPYGTGAADLERFNPNAPSGADSALQAIMSAIEEIRAKKTQDVSRQRDRSIIDAILSGGGMDMLDGGPTPSSQGLPGAPASAPTGLLGKIMSDIAGAGRKVGQYATGADIGLSQLPVSDIEKAIASSVLSSRGKGYKPGTKEELLEVETAKAGIKTKPSKHALLKQAEKRAVTLLGGAAMVGIDEEGRKQYQETVDEEYNKLLSQFSYEPDKSTAERQEKKVSTVAFRKQAAAILTQAGYETTGKRGEENVKALVEQLRGSKTKGK